VFSLELLRDAVVLGLLLDDPHLAGGMRPAARRAAEDRLSPQAVGATLRRLLPVQAVPA